jgi:hypothetical protein
MKSQIDAGHVTGRTSGRVILAGRLRESAKTSAAGNFTRGARNASCASTQKRWRRVCFARCRGLPAASRARGVDVLELGLKVGESEAARGAV